MDASREEKYQKIKQFLNIIWTMVRALEEGSILTNRFEHIGIVKEAVRKRNKGNRLTTRILVLLYWTQS